jgi:hypothetical protein
MKPTHNQATGAGDQPTPAQALRQAALYLQRHGWARGVYYLPAPDISFPPACALGALGMAVHGRVLDNPQDPDLPNARSYARAQGVLADHLILVKRIRDLDEDTIGFWNDESARTAEQVIDALNAAADDWDRIHGGAK